MSVVPSGNVQCARCGGPMLPFREDGGCRACGEVPRTVRLPWRWDSPSWLWRSTRGLEPRMRRVA